VAEGNTADQFVVVTAVADANDAPVITVVGPRNEADRVRTLANEVALSLKAN
jgi:hypothetical protein